MPTWRLVAGETADAGCQHHDEHGASSDCRARHARKSTLQRILFPRLLERSLQAEHHILRSESNDYILYGCRCSLLHIAKDALTLVVAVCHLGIQIEPVKQQPLMPVLKS